MRLRLARFRHCVHNLKTLHATAKAQGRLMPTHISYSPNDPHPVSPTLHGLLFLGQKGPDVKQLQELLNDWLRLGPGLALATDGHFGLNTERQVRALQSQRGAPADGIFGPQTARAVGVNYVGSAHLPQMQVPLSSPPIPGGFAAPPRPHRAGHGLLVTFVDTILDVFHTALSVLLKVVSRSVGAVLLKQIASALANALSQLTSKLHTIVAMLQTCPNPVEFLVMQLRQTFDWFKSAVQSAIDQFPRLVNLLADALNTVLNLVISFVRGQTNNAIDWVITQIRQTMASVLRRAQQLV